MTDKFHEPVLLQESIEYLITNPGGVYLDATIGFGGHSEKFLKKNNSKSKLVGFDKDPNAFEHCTQKFGKDSRVALYNTGFNNINLVSKIEFIEKYDGIFADLGVSSFQLDESASGFTYRQESELDLRMNKNEGIPAYKVINQFKEEDIANILYKYGEERGSRKLAKIIVKERETKPIKKTTELKEIIEKSVPKPYIFKTLSRVFQALRIYVNNELEELEEFLQKSFDLLSPGGRIVIISYHSLEDRIVKESFRYENLECICPPNTPVCICGKKKRLNLITRKPITPSDEEINKNRRARSAKMRVGERI